MNRPESPEAVPPAEEELPSVRRLFPVLGRSTYFNHASSGPVPLTAIAAVNGYLEHTARFGHVPFEQAEAGVEECRALVAQLMRVEPGTVAFTKNTSAGVILGIGSLGWQTGNNVILMRDDFPTVTYPFRLLLPHIEKRWVTSAELAESPEAVFRLTDRNTRCVALSWVSFLTGARADIESIARFCRERNIFFIVDAIQGLGAIEMDFARLDADIVTTHGAKWLLAPQGSGFVRVRPESLDQLKPYNLGWLSCAWTGFNDIFTPKTLWPDARRYEEGTKNYLAIYGLRESLRVILRFGAENVEARIRKLTGILRRGLERAGFEIVTPQGDARSAGIVTCRKPGADMQALHARLEQAGFICSLRENLIRISPHFYNTEDEAERFVSAMSDG